MSTASPFSKDSQHSPGVTQLWQPEWFQTPLIDILNGAWKCRAVQNPSSQEHICLNGKNNRLPKWDTLPSESKHWLPFFQSKSLIFFFFLVQNGISHFFPKTWVPLLGQHCPSLGGSLRSEWSLGERIMQMTNLLATEQRPPITDHVVWMAGRKNPWLSCYRKELSLIYLFSSFCN